MTAAFCQECGTGKPSAIKEAGIGWSAGKLLNADADELIFDLSFVSYDQPEVDLDRIAGKCYEVLRTFCRNYDLVSLQDPSRLVDIGKLLSTNLSTGVYGQVGEFAVIDFKTLDSNWKLQTRAQIRDQLRNIEGQQAQFEVNEAEFALREAQMLRDRRENDVSIREQQIQLERNRSQSEIELDSERIGTRHEVERDRIQADAEIENLKTRGNVELEAEKVSREIDRQKRQLDREDLTDAAKAEREDQILQVDHEMGLEKKVLEHDIGKEQILDTAQREKADKDLEFEDRMERLRASRGLDIAKEKNALDHDKKKSDQELELERVRLEHELELQKLQAMSSIDIAQKEQLKGLTTAQILAMQATGIAEKGAGDALTELAKNDAETREAQIKAEMLEKMLAMQQTSNQSASEQQIKIMMAALDAQKDATIRVEKAHEKTADSAEKWNEKSIDAMSKVATAAANKGIKSDGTKSEKPLTSAKYCPDCGNSLSEGTKFCGECGCKIA